MKEDIIKIIFGIFGISAFIFMAVIVVSKANRDIKEDLKYGHSYPAPYAITYTDGTSDTIQVWKDKEEGDCIDMKSYNYKGGNYISYIPYFKYEKVPTKYKKIFNVVKYKKL